MEVVRPPGMTLTDRRCVTAVEQYAYQPYLTNVALNKPAWMSSTNRLYSSLTNANDGNEQKSIQYCVHTIFRDTSPYRWWRVDLQNTYKIYHAYIVNRGDCCGRRLRDFTIRVARTLNNRTAPKLADDHICVSHKDPVGTGATVRLTCGTPLFGRYFTILVVANRDLDRPSDPYNAPLNICEVEVYGLLTTRINYKQSCKGKEDMCSSQAICQDNVCSKSISFG
ncbi:hypothetical protein ACOMHN_007667 [Nucella lapillus]